MARIGDRVLVHKEAGYTPVPGVVCFVYPPGVGADKVNATVFLRGPASASEGWGTEDSYNYVSNTEADKYVDESTAFPYWKAQG